MAFGTGIDNRLAVYGTLAPGRSNHHVVADLGGTWHAGVVHGQTRQGGWGSALGYPGLIPDPAGPAVPVQLLVSDALLAALEAIDAFEGAQYRRVPIPVHLDGIVVEAWVYALDDAHPGP